MRRLGFILLLAAAALTSAQNVQERFTKREVQITMRDGVKLFTSLYIPKDTTKKHAFLMMRTPYSCAPYGPTLYKPSLGPEQNFTKEDFIFVYQDVRGRYMSEGPFNWMNPYIPNKKPGQADESTDTWDTIDWLLANVEDNNGRVGVYGTSFPGHYAAQCLINPHPALKAASPQAPMDDNWLGDDMHHNGAFFLPHAMNFIAGFGVPREGPTTRYGQRAFRADNPDGYQFFLNLGPVGPNSNDRYNMKIIELWQKWIQHPDYDEYWQPQQVSQHLKKVGQVPVLLVGGWFDAEDLQGPLRIYQRIEQWNKPNKTHIVMGPWYHGSWNGGPGNALWDIPFTYSTGATFRDQLQMPFFKYYLQDEGSVDAIPEAMMFDTGADKWVAARQWPIPEAKPTRFTLADGGGIQMGTVSGKESFVEWLSDPARPVPVSNTISGGMPREYMLEDQRFAWKRPDVISFATPVLAQDVTLAGQVVADLKVSTSGTDSDFVVKLIDVYANDSAELSARNQQDLAGYQMLVRGEPMRARYRNSWSKPEPMPAGKPVRVKFTLPDVCHTFLKGHRIMVQIQSSWFPVVDRNPQTFVKNIFFAQASDFKKATQRVYVGGKDGSFLSIPVLPAGWE